MAKIYQYIGEKLNIKFENNIPNVVVSVPESLLSSMSNILAYSFKQNIQILVVDGITNGTFKSSGEYLIEKGRAFSANILEKLGYSRVKRVWNQSEYSILGDVIVFWKKGDTHVTRISLFDNTVDEIALLEEGTRKLIKKVMEYALGNEENIQTRYSSDTDFEKTLSIYYVRNKIEDGVKVNKVDIGMRSYPGTNISQIEKINRAFKSQNYEIFLSSDSEEDVISDVKRISEDIKRGFVFSNIKIALLSDFELSGKIDLGDYQDKRKKGETNIYKEIAKGDYVVHEDHGIGVYDDLIEQDGHMYLNVHYAGKDRLLIPLSSSNKLSKYVGAGKGKPTLTGLSSGVWLRIKSRAKEDVMAMASELVGIYAMRTITKSTTLVRSKQDIYELNEFVNKFKYSDTEDQSVITQEIVEDLSKNKPMDRLIVGDVGFGKTELAARAMFLAANAGTQVAILAPTTVLSMQHMKVLQERFNEYPFRIEMLNRFVNNSQRAKILSDIEKGLVDIVIGTHSLLSDQVKFKNLSLLIIDEEQKFGVKQKETLKKKRLDVHVLSMTATPIPRTLNMALSGIRDMSILCSVPSGRQSIQNHIGEFDWDVVINAITKEIERGGQVYYLHNRVDELNNIKEELEKRSDGIKAVVAHGQLSELHITEVMSDFFSNKANVLVCSSIIENGLDIPNVNTIIIDDAQRYGLSSLYQIRGRVGRSNKQAYAYVLYSNLKGTASLRLDALAEAHNIGSGFVLSNRDLEIRGAGNILGKSQSGAINSIGYALYTQMLNDAVSSLQDRRY